MNPVLSNTETAEVSKEKHPVFQVTKTSKYLAMFLFIMMPFLGGWIGYQHAPEKMVEVEKVVLIKTEKTNEELLVGKSLEVLAKNHFIVGIPCNVVSYNTGLEDTCYRLLKKTETGEYIVVSENLNDDFQNESSIPNRAISKMHFPSLGEYIYFQTYTPASSACCGTVSYNLLTGFFEELEYRMDRAVGDKVSPSGKFIAKTVDDGALEVVDIVEKSVVGSVNLNDERETLWTSRCGYAGAFNESLYWLDDYTLEYNVYNEEEFLDEHGCDYSFLRTEILELN